jgi:hypothetical protein
MRHIILTLASLGYVLALVSQLQGTQALRIELEPEPASDSQAYHALANNTRTGCGGKPLLYIHFGLGAHGGESLWHFFKSVKKINGIPLHQNNQFSTVWYNSICEGWPCQKLQQNIDHMILEDLRGGNNHLPLLQRSVAEAKHKTECGNVFLGDIKPDYIVGGRVREKNETDPTYQQLFRSLEKAFPDAVWIWLIRHPDKWATSLTHWFPKNFDKDDALQKAREEHALFHCSAWQHFGNRIVGGLDGTVHGNSKGDVVQLNLEHVDWPLFVKQLQDASGYQGNIFFTTNTSTGMPHKGHHEPSWTYPVPDTSSWNSFDYLTEVCKPEPEDRHALFESRPWDDYPDSGL